jgi:hypothetical protein
LVRPRFLPASSVSKAGIETLGVAESGAGGKVTPGGRVFSLGLCDARRLRGFGGDDGGWRRLECGLGASGA